MIRLICLICLICFPRIAWPQQVSTPPPENTFPHLSIFTSPLYKSIPDQAALVNAFATDPNLANVKRGTNFHHYTDRDPLYKARYAKTIPVDRFPAIMLQRADGAYVYKATGSNVPSSPSAIFDEMAYYAKLDPLTGPADSKEARPWRPWQLRDISTRMDNGIPDVDGPPQDCPDGNCPIPNDNVAPSYPSDSSFAPADSVELGGRRHPVRETGALIVILVGCVVGLIVLVGGGLFILGVAWLVSRGGR
jgi:hypothetical protein